MSINIKNYIATYSINAFNGIGIGIVEIEHGIEDYAIVDYIVNNKAKRSRNKIYISGSGRSYIRKYGQRYYIDEFIRTDI